MSIRLLLAGLMLLTLLTVAGDPVLAAESVVSVTIATDSGDLLQKADSEALSLKDFGRLSVPGKPALPARIFAIAIPPGAEIVDVKCDRGDGVVIGRSVKVIPAQLPRVIGEENPALRAKDEELYAVNYASVYESDDAFPESPVEFVRTAGYRGYNLVDVRVTPFEYHPLSGLLIHYPNMTIDVEYEISGKINQVLDRRKSTERAVDEFVMNHKQAESWYTRQAVDSKGINDFVIITQESLSPYVQTLVNWETVKGRSVKVVTTGWIADNYTGYDLAEKIRNFLREKYPANQWGIEDVLFVGKSYQVPMRRTEPNIGYGPPETDFYYAELSQPDSQSWDSNGDHKYGSFSDNQDYYSEINVGRIPWNDGPTVQAICEKSIAYERNDDSAYKKNILLLGAYFWDNTDNAWLMETKIDQPWFSEWTKTRLYEKNGDYWSSFSCDYPLTRSNVLATWTSGTYGFVNWAGHGSPVSTHIYGNGAPAFISSTDCDLLDDSHPAIIFACACSNSDTDHDNIGRAMLRQGAVGFVGATKVAYGCAEWNEPYSGSSQSLDYFFTKCVTSGDYTQGQALYWALRQMYTYNLFYTNNYETFEWGALWGNPNLSMKTVLPLVISFPNGVPESVTPFEPTSFLVRIENIAGSYVPGTAQLNYRIDDGVYIGVPLVSLGGEFFSATIPAFGCAANVEYYVSAESVGGAEVLSPNDAQIASGYIAGVGNYQVVFDDDFETEQGWTVDNGAIQGNWERADPEEKLYWGTLAIQPGDDHTPDGTLCYVTDPVSTLDAHEHDVDGGPTHLISPNLDLTDIYATVSYWRWFHLSNTCDDNLVVSVSNDGGDTWVDVETVDSTEEWTFVEWNVVDYVTPTDQVRVRFTVSDIGQNSITEALVDDFLVTGYECLQVDGSGDLDTDGDVDLADYGIFQQCFGKPAYEYPCLEADLNGDTRVNDLDAQILPGVMIGPG